MILGLNKVVKKKDKQMDYYESHIEKRFLYTLGVI